ncbi:hypothetical protein [Streptomyces sp. NPDC012888]|uniref:hypothetical protein n=1 Tax=Streptomyces sp. NPDC012888 TaxID=3364855 RepID=UPI003699461F
MIPIDDFAGRRLAPADEVRLIRAAAEARAKAALSHSDGCLCAACAARRVDAARAAYRERIAALVAEGYVEDVEAWAARVGNGGR